VVAALIHLVFARTYVTGWILEEGNASVAFCLGEPG
jgi:hypothetical protein